MQYVILAVVLGVVGCRELVPCTECPDVAGDYAIHAEPVETGDNDCPDVFFTGADSVVTVAQDGSKLTVSGLANFPSGTLYDDLTFGMDSVEVTRSGSDINSSVGAVWMSASGRFQEGEGGWTANGTFRFSVPKHACAISAPFTLGPL